MAYLNRATTIGKYSAAFKQRAAGSIFGYSDVLTKDGVPIRLANTDENHASILEFCRLAEQEMRKAACEIRVQLLDGQTLKCGQIDKPKVAGYNNGDLAEGYLAAAITARLTVSSNVTATDVLRVLDGMTIPASPKDTCRTTEYHGVNLTINLPRESMRELLQNPDSHTTLLDSALQFANERVEHTLGDLLVVADGVGLATKTKADVIVYSEHARANAFSVKYKHRQIGQTGGPSCRPLWLTFGIHADSYTEAAEKLTPTAVKTGVQFHACRHDLGVQLVTFNNGSYIMQDFTQLVIPSFTIDIPEGKTENMTINAADGSSILSLRKKTESTTTGSYQRNYVEQGNTLKELTRI